MMLKRLIGGIRSGEIQYIKLSEYSMYDKENYVGSLVLFTWTCH